MSPRRRTKQSAASAKLPVATDTASESHEDQVGCWTPLRVLKAIIGIFLLPAAWVLSATFFTAFQHGVIRHEFWAADEFGFFSVGALAWILAFLAGLLITGSAWPLHVYVFGHELTHAVWVWTFYGNVFQKKMWSDQGGYIVTQRNNFWIALTPYFYPIYSVIVIMCYFAASPFLDVTGSTATFLLMNPMQWLFFLLGLTWAFHFSFTIWMIPKGQTDLLAHGTFFSLVVIYLMNLLVLAIGLIVVAPDLSFASFGRELFLNAEEFARWAWRILRVLWRKAFA